MKGQFVLICKSCEKQFSYIQKNIRNKTFAKYGIDAKYIDQYNRVLTYAKEIIKAPDNHFVGIKKRKISEFLDVDDITDDKIKELAEKKPILFNIDRPHNTKCFR